MPFKKIPLRTLVEKNGIEWADFVQVAEIPAGYRPNLAKLEKAWGNDRRTIKAWIKRWDDGEVE